MQKEIWQLLEERKDGESIMVSAMPKAGEIDEELLSLFELTQEAVAGARNIRKQKNIPFKDAISLSVLDKDGVYNKSFDAVVTKLINSSKGICESLIQWLE